ncbi:MAG: hypothetical protein OXD45_01845, partial [Rhodobacteraceae bacterium]|nr:hypothetical protein [Paracoccaceae bacterium]
ACSCVQFLLLSFDPDIPPVPPPCLLPDSRISCQVTFQSDGPEPAHSPSHGSRAMRRSPRNGAHIAGKGVRPSVGVGAAQGPPLGGVLRVVGPDARPSAQAVANVLEGPGADREAAACGVGHEAGLAALVRRRVGATRHEAAAHEIGFGISHPHSRPVRRPCR